MEYRGCEDGSGEVKIEEGMMGMQRGEKLDVYLVPAGDTCSGC